MNKNHDHRTCVFRGPFSLSCALVNMIPMIVLSASAIAQDQGLPARLAELGPTGPVVKIAGDFEFTEGPAWDGKDSLYFTDIPRNRIHRLTKSGQIEVFLEPSGHANGLMLDARGALIACQMDGQVVSIDIASKKVTPLSSEHNGARFNAPNDLVIDSKGGIYFTDPRYRAPEPFPQGKEAFYYRDPSGKVTRLGDNIEAPNGIILSPDEKTLYVIPSAEKTVRKYAVEAPGKLGKQEVFCEIRQKVAGGNSGGDGLTIDSSGNLYITTGLGIQVYSPKSEYLGAIELPEQPANCTFGGPDNSTIYATARTGLYSIPMRAKGHRFAKAP